MFSKILGVAATAYALTSWLVSGNSVISFCDNFDAEDFVSELIEANVVLSVSNYQYTGACRASGLITFDDETNYVAYTLGLGETALVLTSGNLSTAQVSENTQDAISTNNYEPGDADLESLVRELNEFNYTYTTFDAAIIEFDIVSAINAEVSFEYIFASDEYNEFANTQYNDVFAFWVNGENVALINNSVVVSINNVNAQDLSEYFVDNDIHDYENTDNGYYYNNKSIDSDSNNTIEPLPTEYDGLTVLLSTSLYHVIAGESIHVKLAISDTGDAIYDSAVYLKPKSFHVIGDETEPTTTQEEEEEGTTTTGQSVTGISGGDGTTTTQFLIPDSSENNSTEEDIDDSGDDLPSPSSSGNIKQIGIVVGLLGLATLFGLQ